MHSSSLIVNNQTLRPLLRETYSLEQLAEIRRLLDARGTFNFPRLSTGLFSAAAVTAASAHTGYQSVWVRDNVHIAFAHYRNGKKDVAIATVDALFKFFAKQRPRFDQIDGDPSLAAEPMNRPHVRFDGETISDVDETWAHAQNDALGYFLWLCCLMANEKAIEIGDREAEVLACFPRYFAAIRFWEDEDSGHWEEVRKISASSIGVVVAGLREISHLLKSSLAPALSRIVSTELVDDLLIRGGNALTSILPSECVQDDPSKNRLYDAALLFLVCPLGVVKGERAEKIIENVVVNLQGDYGIKRYLRDSFWCADYKQVPPALRTVDYSTDMASRDSLFTAGGEAQWCLFDPVLSIYFGGRYQATSSKFHINKQTYYFNRSLGQITGADCPFGEFKCPELYYKEGGRIETSEAAPLLWTQANLWLALGAMERSVSAH